MHNTGIKKEEISRMKPPSPTIHELHQLYHQLFCRKAYNIIEIFLKCETTKICEKNQLLISAKFILEQFVDHLPSGMSVPALTHFPFSSNQCIEFKFIYC